MNEEATNFNAGKNASKSLAANDAKLKPAELKVDEDASSSAKDDCLEYTPIATPARGATSLEEKRMASSPLKQGSTGGEDEEETSTISNPPKPRASATRVGNGRGDECDQFVARAPEMDTGTQFVPREPRDDRQPGAFRQDGRNARAVLDDYDDLDDGTHHSDSNEPPVEVSGVTVDQTFNNTDAAIACMPQPRLLQQRQPSEQLFNAVLVEEDDGLDLPYAKATTVSPWWRTRPFVVGFSFLVIGVVIAVVAVTTTRSKSTDPVPPSGPTQHSSISPSEQPSLAPSHFPSLSPTSRPSFAPSLSRLSVLEGIVIGKYGSLPPSGSPQNLALNWAAFEDGARVPLSDTSRLITRYVLAVLYYSTEGSGWVDSANFLSSSHECDWRSVVTSLGVDCDSQRHLLSVNLPNNKVFGTIPREISLLTDLSRLILRGDWQDGGVVNVRSNDITGTIPTEVGQLSNLIQMDLSQNGRLGGTIPTEIAQLTKLVELRLNDDDLDGVIPAVIGSMQSLTYLSLSNNALTGAAPDTLSNVSCVLLDGNEEIICYFRRRHLQAFADGETCSRYVPPCEL
jgi:hypothetical protein